MARFVNPRLAILCSLLVLGGAAAESLAQVVVVGAKSPLGPQTKEQVTAAFMGKIPSIEPIDQSERTPIREEFYLRELGKSASQMKSHWAKISFTGKGMPPKEYPNSAEVKKALASNPYAIGYIETDAVDASVRVVFGER